MEENISIIIIMSRHIAFSVSILKFKLILMLVLYYCLSENSIPTVISKRILCLPESCT